MSSHSFDSARSGAASRAAWFAVPALVAIVGTSGVTVRPVLEKHAAARELELANRRARSFEAARLDAERFEAAGGMARLDAALAAVTEVLPQRIAPVEIAALCGLIAERHGIALDGTTLGEPRETHYAVLGDRVVAIDAELTGRATLAALARIVPDLRAAGLPCAVIEASLARRDPAAEVFDFRLTLELCRRAERLAAPVDDLAVADDDLEGDVE